MLKVGDYWIKRTNMASIPSTSYASRHFQIEKKRAFLRWYRITKSEPENAQEKKELISMMRKNLTY